MGRQFMTPFDETMESKPPEVSKSAVERLVMPSKHITVEMVKLARVEDDWHFAANLNALMEHGYCRICGLTPNGCKREGCGA